MTDNSNYSQILALQIEKGQRVSHPDFGQGVVVNPRGRNGWILVDFDSGVLDAKCALSRIKAI